MGTIRFRSAARLFLEYLDERHTTEKHFVEIEPVDTNEIRLPPATERFQAIQGETRIADEQTPRPGGLTRDLSGKRHEIHKADLRAVPLGLDEVSIL